MRRRGLCAVLCATTLATALTLAQSSSPSQPDSSTVPVLDENPSAWFVELASPPTSEGTPMPILDREASSFRASALAAGVQFTTGLRFRRLWNGMVVRTDEGNASRLLALPGVKAIYPVVNAVRTQQERDPTSVAHLATALAMTGADVANDKLGLTGRGVRAAVIDSGIDYDHPDLGGCFGPGCRVATGFDFVGDAFNPDSTSTSFSPTPRPDRDPDDCDGHGTHVAGILGAKGALNGVAPGVTFGAYRVFGCEGPTTTEVILAALERVVVDGADIVNLSLGVPLQWPQYPTSQAAARLVKFGMVVVTSAGNDANLGLYGSSAPGTAREVISVASFNNSHTNVSAFRVSPDGKLIGYSGATAAPPAPLMGSFPLVRTGTATTEDDACAPLPAGRLAGRVALIRRGTCGFTVKVANARAAGAAGVVFYNNVPGRLPVTVAGAVLPVTIPVVSITQADGVELDTRLAAGLVTLTWTADEVSEPQATGGLISSFSSWGPTPDLLLKPDLGAPGGPVRSTLPVELGSYGAISGTSQAAPHVAGAVALMLEADPKLTADDILTRLQNSSRPSLWSGNPALGYLDATHRQGAGLMAIDRALTASVVVQPSRLALGEFERGAQVRALSLSETAGLRPCKDRPQGRKAKRRKAGHCDAVTYRVGHTPGLATGANPFSPVLYAGFATVEFDRQTLTAADAKDDRSFDKKSEDDGADEKPAPSASARLLVRITPPPNPEVRLFSGYITFTPDDGSAIVRVPYVGYNGDYQAIQALAPTPLGFPWLAKLTGTTLANQPNGATFTMQGTDVPFILHHLDHQVRKIRTRVIDVATGRSFAFADRRDYLSRNSAPTSFFAFAWDGTTTPPRGSPQPMRLPNGTYRLEVSVLKALGDPRNPHHTERWTSPPITITRTR